MTLYFPDVASFQGGMSLAGALAVCAKVTQGTGYVNPAYPGFRGEAQQHGTFFTAYHFLTQGSGAAQAGHCFANAGRVPLMLDFEPDPGAGSVPRTGDAEAFIDAYRRQGGTVHAVYLPDWYWVQIGRPSLAGLTQRGCFLWSSDYSGGYTDAGTGAGWLPYGGMTPLIWQYSSTTPFNGRRIDFSAFRGTHAGDQSPAAVADTLTQFRALMSAGKLPAPARVHEPKPGTPLRMAADGQTSLLHAGARWGFDAWDVVLATGKAKAADEDWGPLQHPYFTARDFAAPMPKGMIYYVYKP